MLARDSLRNLRSQSGGLQVAGGWLLGLVDAVERLGTGRWWSAGRVHGFEDDPGDDTRVGDQTSELNGGS